MEQWQSADWPGESRINLDKIALGVISTAMSATLNYLGVEERFTVRRHRITALNKLIT